MATTVQKWIGSEYEIKARWKTRVKVATYVMSKPYCIKNNNLLHVVNRRFYLKIVITKCCKAVKIQ